MARCIQCGKEADAEIGTMKVISCDGDFVCDNGVCEAAWLRGCSLVDSMSDAEFEAWMCG